MMCLMTDLERCRVSVGKAIGFSASGDSRATVTRVIQAAVCAVVVESEVLCWGSSVLPHSRPPGLLVEAVVLTAGRDSTLRQLLG